MPLPTEPPKITLTTTLLPGPGTSTIIVTTESLDHQPNQPGNKPENVERKSHNLERKRTAAEELYMVLAIVFGALLLLSFIGNIFGELFLPISHVRVVYYAFLRY